MKCCGSGSTCFLGLLDPDPDPLVRGMDPDPSIIKQNHLFYCFVTSFWLFIFEKWCKRTFKKKYAKKLFKKKNSFLLASWRSMMKIEGSGSASGSGFISQRHGSGSGSGSTPKCHGSATLMRWKLKRERMGSQSTNPGRGSVVQLRQDDRSGERSRNALFRQLRRQLNIG